MSELAVHAQPTQEGPFRPATVLLLLAVGVGSFIALLVLGAYAPDLRSGRNGGAHALSTGATGYAAVVELARATGRNPTIARSKEALDSEDLVILTPETGTADLSEALERRQAKPTLIVFPKWTTRPDAKHPGWVRLQGPRPAFDPERTLAPNWPLDVERHKEQGTPLRTASDYTGKPLRLVAPAVLQTLSGKSLKPIVTDASGATVVGQLGGGALYVLADPDLISNAGMASLDQARSALELLDYLNSTDADGMVFDVTLNGLGRSKSPLKLMFDPPFLATTLAIAAALLLAGLYALRRFGPARRPERALAFGKAALVDNTAALVRRGRRESALGGRYAAMIRDRAVARLRAPRGLAAAEADSWLDRLPGKAAFSALARRADDAADRHELLAAARALHDWEKETKG